MGNFEMTIEQAKEMAKPIVDILDKELVLTDICPAIITNYNGEKKPSGYTLIYTRQFSGVNSNYAVGNNEWKYQKGAENVPQGDEATNSSGGVTEVEIPQTNFYKEPYPQESLVITVGMNGIHSVSYSSPMKINETLATNMDIMPFDKVQEKFDQYIVLNGFNPSSKVYLKIDRIQLGMMRISQQNKPNEYLIVPVWDFYGYYKLSDVNEKFPDNPNPMKIFGRSYVTINAVDGSIIDRALGY